MSIINGHILSSSAKISIFKGQFAAMNKTFEFFVMKVLRDSEASIQE